MPLILNADDFGLTVGMNQAIEQLALAGRISSTSIMVNIPYVEAITSLVQRQSQLGIGVHLNLTFGKPLTQAASLTAPDGNFWSKQILVNRLRRRLIRKEDCLRELNAQVELAKNLLGNRLDHWNSHEGIHRYPQIFQTATSITRYHQIRAMRSHRHFFLFADAPSGQVYRPSLKTLFRFKPRRIAVETYYSWITLYSARLFKMPKGLLILNSAGVIDTLRYLGQTRMPDGTWEIPCHPSISNEGLTESQLKQPRRAEYEYLMSDEFDEVLESQKVKLMSFHAL